MAILNYTTRIKAGRTAAEIQATLAKHGANLVSVVYADGNPAGIAFSIDTEFGPRNFRLPANVDGVEATITAQRKSGEISRDARYSGHEHARNVAWRILKDWIAAQLAVIEAGLASLDEIMLPYMISGDGRSVITAYRESASVRAALESGDG